MSKPRKPKYYDDPVWYAQALKDLMELYKDGEVVEDRPVKSARVKQLLRFRAYEFGPESPHYMD